MLKFKTTAITLVLFFKMVLSQNNTLTPSHWIKYNDHLRYEPLYSEEDNIVILSGNNFTQEIYRQPRVLILQFFNIWCGHCQRFAHKWKAIGTQLQNFTDVLALGVLDCYEEENIATCRNMEITETPTIRYFHEYYVDGPNAIGINIMKNSSISIPALISKIFRIIAIEQRKGRAYHFPIMVPFSGPAIRFPGTELFPQLRYVILVLEKRGSPFGAEIALRLRQIPFVVVRFSQGNLELCLQYGIKKLAALVAINRENKAVVIGEGFKTISSLYKPLRTFLRTNRIGAPGLVPMSDIQNEKPGKPEKPGTSGNINQDIFATAVFLEDMETVLRHSFKFEIGGLKDISGEKLETLVKYVHLLEKYFPVTAAIKQFLEDLKKNIVASGESVSGANIIKWFKDAEAEGKKVFNFPETFTACKGSESRYRGYTCGLWKLFHYLTVNAALYQQDPEAFGQEVLDVVLAYVKDFFKCRECSKHFQKMAAEDDMAGVNSTGAAVIWLWRAHNKVNKRLAGDFSEDPAFPKIQFPLAQHCPQCKDSNQDWNVPEVVEYLLKMYAKENIKYVDDGRILVWNRAL